MSGRIGFSPARRRQPEPFDWEVLDGGAERGAEPDEPVDDPVAAEIVVLAEPAARTAGPVVVAVIGARGGCGRTAVAALLAATLASPRPAGHPGRVGAADAVPAVGDLAARLDAVPLTSWPLAPGATHELVVVDCPAGVGQLDPILARAGQLVVVLGPRELDPSPDLRLLDWLDVGGYDRLLRGAVALRPPGRPDGLDAQLAQRCRAVVGLPRDAHPAAGLDLAAAVEGALAAPPEPDPGVQELLAAYQLAAMTVPGYLGAGTRAPVEGRPAWRLALAFAGPEALAVWLDSPARAACHEAASRHGGFAARTVTEVGHLG